MNDENLRTLRTGYEKLKPWEQFAAKAGDPAKAAAAFDRYTAVQNEVFELGKSLGYTEESIQAAFEEDAVDTLAHLRGEMAKQNPQFATRRQIEEETRRVTREALKPVNEEINRQKTDVAIRTYENELNRLIDDDKVGFGPDMPKELRTVLHDIINLYTPDNVLADIKVSGKVAGVQAVFNDVKTSFLSAVNHYNTWMNGKAGNGNGNANAGNGNGNGNGNGAAAAKPNGGNKPLTLDDIINDAGVLPGLKAGRY